MRTYVRSDEQKQYAWTKIRLWSNVMALFVKLTLASRTNRSSTADETVIVIICTCKKTKDKERKCLACKWETCFHLPPFETRAQSSLWTAYEQREIGKLDRRSEGHIRRSYYCLQHCQSREPKWCQISFSSKSKVHILSDSLMCHCRNDLRMERHVPSLVKMAITSRTEAHFPFMLLVFTWPLPGSCPNDWWLSHPHSVTPEQPSQSEPCD